MPAETINVEYTYTMVTRKFENVQVTIGSSMLIDWVDADDREVLYNLHKDNVRNNFLKEVEEAYNDTKRVVNG